MVNPIREIINLLFAPQCTICGAPLPESVEDICLECRWELPLTYFWKDRENPVSHIFWGHFPIETASAYFFYINQGRWRALVHHFKYRGGWRMAQLMGKWFGLELAASEHYRDIDLIVPIPLHPIKKLKRGYNQSEYIARGIAQHLDKPIDTRSVRRHRNNGSQARQHHTERWSNVENIFSVRDIEALRGRHILLVDDVLTSGATVISCAETIYRIVPDVRISVVALGVAGKLQSPPKPQVLSPD